jgi:thiol-disulfide isomerase/thioredoxin
MKKLIIIISILCAAMHSIGSTKYTPGDFTISGHISNWNNRYIYFSCKGIGNDRIWDTALVKNNSFKFKGNLKEPLNGFITILKNGRMNNLLDSNITKRLFICPADMTINLVPNNFQNAKLEGSKYQDEYYKLERSKSDLYKKSAPISDLFDSLNKQYIPLSKSPNDSVVFENLKQRLDSLKEKLDSLGDECIKIDRAFFNKNPDSYVTSYMLNYYYTRFDIKDLITYYNAMSATNKQWEYGIELKEAIQKLSKSSPGAKAAKFSTVDINGDTISLSKFKGQYLLLDFWASWCAPCRAENPELIRLYNKYKNKGIEFIGVADDYGTEDKWKAAILKDKTAIWRQVLDDNMGVRYSVHTIPLQILIDKDGNIIGRFGDGGEPIENLAKRMGEVFGK